MIENLVAHEQAFDLRSALQAAAPLLPLPCDESVIAEVLAFISGRLAVVMREAGYTSAVVKAVLAELAHDPTRAMQTAGDLSAAMEADDWSDLLNAYARCVRITRSLETQFELRPADFAVEEEIALYAAYQAAAAEADGTLPGFVSSLRQMAPAISAFFEAILVMDEDMRIRENRLALLQQIANMTQGTADLSYLPGF